MNQPAIFFFLLGISIYSYTFGQDTSWKEVSVTPNLSISMPGAINTMDTAQLKIWNSQAEGYYFQVKYIKPKYEVRNGDELIQAYDGFLKGYLNSQDIRIYTNTVSDTFINSIRGEWIHSTYSNNNDIRDM